MSSSLFTITRGSISLASDFTMTKLSWVFTDRILIFYFQSSNFWFLFLSKSFLIFEDYLANLSSLFNRIIWPSRSGVLMPGNMNHKPAFYPISVPLLFRLLYYNVVCPFTVKSLRHQLAFGYTAVSFKVKRGQYCHHLIAYYFLY